MIKTHKQRIQQSIKATSKMESSPQSKVVQITDDELIPDFVFLVPYRNRPQQKYFFCNYLTSILNKSNKYEIYFVHQNDKRHFNRGAMKDIGFYAIKEKYPYHYQNITLVFNDVDTMPFYDFLEYKTTQNIVKHFYGFTNSLGGILSITGGDFEMINGFPCFWGWGGEDNVLQDRCNRYGLTIDRSQFNKVGSSDILHLFDGVDRILNTNDPWNQTHDDGTDGINTITKLKYTIDELSTDPRDNVFTQEYDNVFFINVRTFMVKSIYEQQSFAAGDIRTAKRIIKPIHLKQVNGIINDWTNIPFYPSDQLRYELEKLYGTEEADKLFDYAYANDVEALKGTPVNVLSKENLKDKSFTAAQFRKIVMQDMRKKALKEQVEKRKNIKQQIQQTPQLQQNNMLYQSQNVSDMQNIQNNYEESGVVYEEQKRKVLTPDELMKTIILSKMPTKIAIEFSKLDLNTRNAMLELKIRNEKNRLSKINKREEPVPQIGKYSELYRWLIVPR